MPALFLNGNTNQHTFANAAAAAHLADLQHGGRGLTDVFVLHSPQSELALASTHEWRDFLRGHGIEPELFAPFTVDLSRGKDAIARVARHLERCVASVDRRDDVYVDLTNGASLYKSVLANIAYLLGVRRTFFLDPGRAHDLHDGSTPTRVGFLTAPQLLAAYVEFPDPALLDAVAPEWLTEVRRFNLKARSVSDLLRSMSGASDSERAGFESDIANAVHSWFRGEKAADGAALGGAVRHVGRAFEDLVRSVLKAMLMKEPKKGASLHEMLQQVSSRLEHVAAEYEPHLLVDIAQLLRRLRNASTHEQTSPAFGRIRARLSTELLFATSEYFRILDSLGLLQKADVRHAPDRNACAMTGVEGERYFIGIDGDDTGHRLEELFRQSADGEQFSTFSSRVAKALEEVAVAARQTPLCGTVHFCAGDDLLLEGNYDAAAVRELQVVYERRSGGMTCSVGFGRTAREAYVALKMAKASPGKGRVIGVAFVDRSEAAQQIRIARAQPRAYPVVGRAR